MVKLRLRFYNKCSAVVLWWTICLCIYFQTFNSFLVSMNVLACTSVCLFASIVGSSETFVPFLIGVLSIVLQYEDIVQLEWLSNFVEDSFSGGSIGLNKEDGSIVKDSPHHQFQTSSPVSVLESSSSCSGGGGKTIPLSPNHRGAQRARSKRPRPATFNPRPAIQLISPTSSVTESPQPILVPKASSDSENYAESSPLKKMPKPAAAEHKKKKKMKLSLPLGPVEMNQNPPAQAVRKCMHCEITKTPQWRAGPMGPKTLCNACGVRYKSGRLFPEYRPAASPTFVPALHSNSHKKVIEMRNKACENTAMTASAPTGTTSPPELIPNSSVSLDYMWRKEDVENSFPSWWSLSGLPLKFGSSCYFTYRFFHFFVHWFLYRGGKGVDRSYRWPYF